jgi:hypothetical protein
MTDPGITQDWLKSIGFRWHQMDRQPDKHWLLWLGDAVRDGNSLTSYEDIGVEIAPAWWKNSKNDDVGEVGRWHCWFRSDAAGRYHRFIHLRYLRTQAELVALLEALSGTPFVPENNLYGSMRTPEQAARIRKEDQRLDRQIMLNSGPHHKWADVEKDDSRGRALPEHYEAFEKGRAK